jgi:hypothetical protein
MSSQSTEPLNPAPEQSADVSAGRNEQRIFP